MKRDIRYWFLVDDSPSEEGLSAEHGLSIWIEADGFRILFDCGQSDAFLRNAHELDIPVDRASAVVISHGHYDHTGGLEYLDFIDPHIPVYVHPVAIPPRYRRTDEGNLRAIGMPDASRRFLQSRRAQVRWTLGPTQINDGVWLTGAVPRGDDLPSFEEVSPDFSLDPERLTPDPVTDDQTLWIDTPQGLWVFFGCAHAGVVRTLNYIQRLSQGRPIASVVGGLHLAKVSQEQLAATREFLDGLNLAHFDARHCSGEPIRQFGKR